MSYFFAMIKKPSQQASPASRSGVGDSAVQGIERSRDSRSALLFYGKKRGCKINTSNDILNHFEIY